MRVEKAKVPAVVVGGRLSGLGLVRSLRCSKVPVVVIDVSRNRPAMWSIGCQTLVVDELGGRALVDSLLALAARISERPVLFLTDDLSIHAISEHRKELERYYRFCLPPHDTLVDLFDKAHFQRIAEENGFTVPRAIVLETEADLEQLRNLKFPVIIKPADRRVFLLGQTERNHKVGSVGEAMTICRRMLPNATKIIVQEWITGSDSTIFFCLFYRGKDGATVGAFTGQKLRADPPGLGSTAVCRAAPEIGKLLEPIAMAFADRLDFNGMGSIEFKWDAQHGRFAMIEPTVGRVDWQEEIATLCGTNLPLMAYHHELGLAPIPPVRITTNIVWRASYLKWIKWWPGRKLRAGARIYDGYWRLDDPGPAIFYYFFYCPVESAIRFVLKPIASKLRKNMLHAVGS